MLPRQPEKTRQHRHAHIVPNRQIDDDEAEAAGADQMIGGASCRARIGHAHDRQRVDIDAAGGDIRRKKRAVFEGDPRRAIAGELRLEHEPEGRGQRRGVRAGGQLDKTPREIGHAPDRRLARDMERRGQNHGRKSHSHPPRL